MQKNIYIYLDDERTPIWKSVPADTSIIICRSYKEAVDAVNLFSNKGWTNLFIDLDHDLGTKKTGYDFCKWLISKGFVGKFHCHTANPVGRSNIKQLLNHYGWKEF